MWINQLAQFGDKFLEIYKAQLIINSIEYTLTTILIFIFAMTLIDIIKVELRSDKNEE